MADNDNLLEKLSEGHLPPAVPESQEPQPSEPTEPTEGRDFEQGRAPSDVVQPRERQYEEPVEETTIPAASKKRQREVKTYNIDGQSYTVAELEASGLLERVVQTARQMPVVQRRYAELLKEQQAAAQQAAPAEVPVITNLQIAQVYDQVAVAIINDLISNGGLIEEDLAEAYPRTMTLKARRFSMSFNAVMTDPSRLESRAG
jgi:hypothetical protein